MASNTTNRLIARHGDLVFLWINNRPPTYTDRWEVMEPILEMPIWSWHWKADGRIGAVVSVEGGKAGVTGEPYIYQLRWAAEHYGAQANNESIAAAMENMRRDFRAGDYNLDHLDSNFRNCCLWNLAKMTRSQNAAKHSLTAKIYKPYFWFSVNTGNGYRVLCGSDIDDPRKVFCNSVEDYLEYLRSFCEMMDNSTCFSKEPIERRRVGYDLNGTLTDLGERMIGYLRTAPDEDFVLYRTASHE